MHLLEDGLDFGELASLSHCAQRESERERFLGLGVLRGLRNREEGSVYKGGGAWSGGGEGGPGRSKIERERKWGTVSLNE